MDLQHPTTSVISAALVNQSLKIKLLCRNCHLPEISSSYAHVSICMSYTNSETNFSGPKFYQVIDSVGKQVRVLESMQVSLR